MEERFGCFDVKPESLIVFLGELGLGSLRGCRLTESCPAELCVQHRDLPPHHEYLS